MGMKKKLAVVLCAALALCTLASCGPQGSKEPEKTVVTMVYSEKLEHMEALIEE